MFNKINDRSLFVERFSSGYITVAGRYSLRYPIMFGRLLTVQLTDKRIVITSLGLPIYEIKLCDIFKITVIRSKIMGSAINVASADGKGFLFYTTKIDEVVKNIRELKIPITSGKFSWISHILALIILIMAILFVILGIYSLFIFFTKGIIIG